jgi:TonB family protein
MRPRTPVVLFLFATFLIAAATTQAQEAITSNGTVMLRYPQGEGIYHYLNNCLQSPTNSTPAPNTPPAANNVPAICWAITAFGMKSADGTEHDPIVGKLSISATEIQFAPTAATNQQFAYHLPVSETSFTHQPGQTSGTLVNQGAKYEFVFTKICDGCNPATAASVTAAPAALDAEFDLVEQSLEQFEPTNQHVLKLEASATARVSGGGVMGGMMGNGGPPPVLKAPQPPNGPVRVSSGVILANLIEKHDPIYPPAAEAANVQGSVILRAILSKTGTIENLQIISGPPMLQASAMDAVRRWRFRPYLLNGDPVEVDTVFTLRFDRPPTPPLPATPPN